MIVNTKEGEIYLQRNGGNKLLVIESMKWQYQCYNHQIVLL